MIGQVPPGVNAHASQWSDIRSMYADPATYGLVVITPPAAYVAMPSTLGSTTQSQASM